MKGGNVAGLLLAYQACLLIIIIKALTDLQIGVISWIPPDLPSLLAIIRRMFSVYAMYHCILMHPTCINLHPACISLIQFILSRFLVKIIPVGLACFKSCVFFCPFQDRNLPPSLVSAGLLYYLASLPCQPSILVLRSVFSP